MNRPLRTLFATGRLFAPASPENSDRPPVTTNACGRSRRVGGRRRHGYALAWEPLETRALMAAPTGMEQELLEYVNRMRLDPQGEFARLVNNTSPITSPIPGVTSALQFFNVDKNLLQTQFAALTSVAPLAWNDALNVAASGHNAQMIAADQQSHQLPGEGDLSARATSAGYAGFQSLAENIFAFGESVSYTHAGFAIDWGNAPGGIQNPPGHRNTIMSSSYREVGIAITPENNNATNVGPLVTTQDFGSRFNAGNPFALGVVYQDTNGDGYYTAGEGAGGVTVTVTGPNGTFSTATWASGGYQIPLPAGNYTATFSGGGLAAPINRPVNISGENVKVDAVVGAVNPIPGQLQFSAATASVAEGGSAIVTINRIGGSDGVVSVNVGTIAGGSATAGVDFTPVNTTLNFAAGETTKQITVPIAQDAVYEGNETIFLALSAPSGGATLAIPQNLTLTVLDDDPQPQAGVLTFAANAFVTKEDGGGLTLTVNRLNGSDGTVSVNYATTAGTATPGADYSNVVGTLTFQPGVTSQTVLLPIIPDALIEGDETFTIALTNPTNGAALGAASQATVTIQDVQPANNGKFQWNTSVLTVAENAGPATLTVNRVGGTEGAVSVSFGLSGGTAILGTDMHPFGGTLNFAPGEASKTVSITIIDDTLYEPTETFQVVLNTPTGGAALGSPAIATVEITNDDPLPAGDLQFAAATVSVNENAGQALLTVTRTNGSAGVATVDYGFSGMTATPGVDFSAVAGTLTFPDGVLSRTIAVPIIDDMNFEGNESFTVTLSNPGGVGAGLGTTSTSTVTIVENDNAPAGELRFSAPTYAVVEGTPSLVVTVTRVNGSNGVVTVNYATQNLTATAGADYTAATGALTFNNFVTSQSIVIPILSDAVFEGDETFRINLSNPTGGATLGAGSTAVATIVDDDVAPRPGTLSLASGAASIRENGGVLALTVNRTAGSDGLVTVNYAVNNGSAVAGVDFTNVQGVLDFPAGVTSRTISIPILQDLKVEPTETFTVNLSGPGGGAVLGGITTTTVSITDDDIAQPGALQFRTATMSVGEGAGLLTVVVDRLNGTDGAVSVGYAVTGGTASAGADFGTSGGVINFPAGVASQMFTIPILQDALVEGPETLILSLQNPIGGAVLGGNASTTITIVDDEPAPLRGNLQFSTSAYAVSEAGGSAVLTVVRDGGSAGAVTVGYTTASVTATAGADFSAVSGTLTFADGVISQSIVVPILQDNLIDNNEAFTVSLSAPTGGALLGSPSIAAVTIQDDDVIQPGQLAFVSSSFTTREDVGVFKATVERRNGSDGEVSVAYTVADGTARSGLDFGAISGILSFPAGVTTQTISIPILQDGLYEGSEGFTLILNTPTNGAGLATPSVADVTITDDELPPGVSTFVLGASNLDVGESGGNVTITVNRIGLADRVATVTLITDTAAIASGSNLGSATAGLDYVAALGTLTFEAGVTTKTFAIPILSDAIYEGNERFLVRLTNASGASLGVPSEMSVTILDDDANTGNPGPAPSVLQVSGIQFANPSASANPSAVLVTFNQSVTTASATNKANYRFRTAGADNVFQTPDDVVGRALSATYDDKTRTVKLTPDLLISLNSFVQVEVSGAVGGVTAGNGKVLDGDGDNIAGGDYVTRMGLGTNLRFVDSDGDTAVLSVSRGGLLDMRLAPNGNPTELNVLSGAAGRSILTGVIRRGRFSNGQVVIPRAVGLENVIMNLQPGFRIQKYGRS